MASKIKIKKIKVNPINKPSQSASDAMHLLMQFECIFGINRYFHLHRPTSIEKLLYTIYVITLIVLVINVQIWELHLSANVHGPTDTLLIFFHIGGDLCYQLLKIIQFTFFSKRVTIAYFERLQEFDSACDSRTISVLNAIANKEIILMEVLFLIFLSLFVFKLALFSMISALFSFCLSTLEFCYQTATMVAILARVLVLEHQLKHKTRTLIENEATVNAATYYRMLITSKFIKSLVLKENKAEIPKLHENYLILFKSSVIWNETFGLVIAIRYVFCALSISFLIANVYDHTIESALSASAAKFFIHLMFVVIPHVIGEIINKSLKRMRGYILKRLVNESVHRRELKAFLARLESKPIIFTVWSLFKLDLSSLLTSLSYIFVLVLIISQFSDK